MEKIELAQTAIGTNETGYIPESAGPNRAGYTMAYNQ